MERVQSLTMERDGLVEAITVLEAYVGEVYKEEEPSPGLKMAMDKLRDKVRLVFSELEWITRTNTSE